jgi:hypothetical protein
MEAGGGLDGQCDKGAKDFWRCECSQEGGTSAEKSSLAPRRVANFCSMGRAGLGEA